MTREESAVDKLRKGINPLAINLLQAEQRADLSQVRVRNERLILNHLRRHGPLPRVEIADTLHLSRATVSSIISSLEEQGLVREGKRLNATSKGGKRPIEVQFNADAGYIIGLDIGRSHLTMLIRNLEAEEPNHDSPWRWSGAFDTSPGAEACLPLVASKLHDLVENNDITWGQVVGIGLGIPGPMDRDRQKLARPTMMPKWDEVDIPAELRKLLRLEGRPKIPITMDNDANMGALGESRYGAGRDCRHLAYIKIGTGIGAGLIFDGHLYRGYQGCAGEFGHFVADKNGPKCDNCGNYGCLESLAAEPAIIREAGSVSKDTSSATNLPHTLQHSDEKITLDKIVELAKSGNENCMLAIKRAGERVGIALAGLINLLNPEVVLLDGGVIRAAGELFSEPLSECAYVHSIPVAKGTEILTGKLGSDAIAYGAVASIIDAAFGSE